MFIRLNPVEYHLLKTNKWNIFYKRLIRWALYSCPHITGIGMPKRWAPEAEKTWNLFNTAGFDLPPMRELKQIPVGDIHALCIFRGIHPSTKHPNYQDNKNTFGLFLESFHEFPQPLTTIKYGDARHGHGYDVGDIKEHDDLLAFLSNEL